MNDTLATISLPIVDRLIVKKEYRNSSIAHRIILATYQWFEGRQHVFVSFAVKTNFCQCICVMAFANMRNRQHFLRVKKGIAWCSFYVMPNICRKLEAPFLEHLPAEMDDKGYYVVLVKKRLGICFANGGVCQGNCCVEKNQNHHSLIEIADKRS